MIRDEARSAQVVVPDSAVASDKPKPKLASVSANWVGIPHAIIFDRELSDQAYRVACMLIAFKALGKGCYPSQFTLASLFGSRTAVQSALRELRKREFISVRKIGRRNSYELSFPSHFVPFASPKYAQNSEPVDAPNSEHLGRGNMLRIRSIEKETRVLKNNNIKNTDADGINPTAIRALAIQTRLLECGLCDKDAAGLARALVGTDIPIGLIVEATWDVMRRPARLRDKVSNLIGYVLASVHRKAAKTPMEIYQDELEAYDPTGEIYLASIDAQKRARIDDYLRAAGLAKLSGPRLRDVANYLDYLDRMSASFARTS